MTDSDKEEEVKQKLTLKFGKLMRESKLPGGSAASRAGLEGGAAASATGAEQLALLDQEKDGDSSAGGSKTSPRSQDGDGDEAAAPVVSESNEVVPFSS